MSEVRTHKTYSYETKIAGVKDFYEQGLSKFEVLEKYQIKSSAVLKAWFRLFNQGGYEAIKPRKSDDYHGALREVPISVAIKPC